MTSTRPYLIRAFYDWIVDNDCTPYIVINSSEVDVDVPKEYVEDGQIVLNIAMSAVNGLILGDHAVEFQARFGGKIRRVYAPVPAIIAIYAKENGRGMVFAEEEEGDDPLSPPPPPKPETKETKNKDEGDGKKGGKKTVGRSHLTVVK
jgi:stringent starvation protein B